MQAPSDEIDERLLEELLEEEAQFANITEGIRRAVLTQMELRDQPVLDKFQDEIFRLPLDSRILLLGPPGTGKTTTLIRRLGQKLDLEFLSEDEQSLAQRLEESAAKPHETSWLMFTPTSLLQYVKESFSRERVPASDHHVRTWADYRLEAARNVYGLLRTPAKRGGFVLREPVEYFGDEALTACGKTQVSLADFPDFGKFQSLAAGVRLRLAPRMTLAPASGGDFRAVPPSNTRFAVPIRRAPPTRARFTTAAPA